MPVAITNGLEEHAQSAMFAETPFLVDPVGRESEQEGDHESGLTEMASESWEVSTPFLTNESGESGENENFEPETAAFAEIIGELKDSEFRESLERLADEAVDVHSEQLSGEYGDSRSRGLAAERLLNDHFAPLVAQAEAMLDRFSERLEGYETESISDHEIEHLIEEMTPSGAGHSPATEQFLGGLLRKFGKIASGAVSLAKKGVAGAVKLAGKGLALAGKLALGPLLGPLKKLAKFLLGKVVKFALNKMPPRLRPIGQKLADRLFNVVGVAHEGEIEGHEQSENEVLPAAPDSARLEAEFDVQAAQLLFIPDEAEADHLVSNYGEEMEQENSSSMADLDRARAELVEGISNLKAGETAQPVIEHFLPAIGLVWTAAKTAIAIMGRPKVKKFLGGLLAKLTSPLVGPEAAQLISPFIADAGLRLLGLETAEPSPRTVAAEALAATIEETLTGLGELPPHVLENETLLGAAVTEAFENAAASYFPDTMIKPELRETADKNGMWSHMPERNRRREYLKYSQTLPVMITPRVAAGVGSFGSATLHDHIRDHLGHPHDRPLKAKLSLYQAIPGTTGSAIARREGFPAHQLHPLTPHAAGALLGPNSALGSRHTPTPYLDSPQKLHVGQRLYRIEPPNPGHHHHHVRPVRSEMMINLQKGHIRLWVYLSEPLCQLVSAELAKGNKTGVVYGRLKHLLHRTSVALKMALHHKHLPSEIMIIGETPNLEGETPHWIRSVGGQMAGKIAEWTSMQVAQYFQNKGEDFRRLCAQQHDGVTLRITMTKVPGMEMLRLAARRHARRTGPPIVWPKGMPTFEVLGRAGYLVNR